VKFTFSDTFTVDTSLEPWKSEGLRVGFFANPGAGKSWTCALLVEQWLDQGGTVVVFEPRAEWHTLKQRYPVQVVGGPFLQDVPLVDGEPGLYAKVVVEQGVSLVIYTGDIQDEEKLVSFVAEFVARLLRLEEQYHRPVLVVIEETQEYAPRTSQGHIAPPWVYNRMIKALKDCFTQGRKLNVCPVAISQRPQEVNFTIRQLCNLVWFGGFSAQDAKYLDTEVFAPFRRNGVDVSAQDLLGVPSGQWLVITGRTTTHLKVTEKRKTQHGADTPTLEYVQPVSESLQKVVSDLGHQLQAMLEKRAAEESELEKAKRRIRELTTQVQDLEGKVKLGLDLRALLQAPDGLDEADVKRRILAVEERYEKQVRDLEQANVELRQQIPALEELRQVNEKLKDQVSKFTALEDLLRSIVEPLIPVSPAISDEAIERIVEAKIQKLASKQRRQVGRSGETGMPWVDMWLPKLGSAERKIVMLLAQKFPLALTKSQVALGCGLSVNGGHFIGSLSSLVKWKLVERIGDSYKLAEAPA